MMVKIWPSRKERFSKKNLTSNSPSFFGQKGPFYIQILLIFSNQVNRIVALCVPQLTQFSFLHKNRNLVLAVCQNLMATLSLTF